MTASRLRKYSNLIVQESIGANGTINGRKGGVASLYGKGETGREANIFLYGRGEGTVSLEKGSEMTLQTSKCCD